MTMPPPASALPTVLGGSRETRKGSKEKPSVQGGSGTVAVLGLQS